MDKDGLLESLNSASNTINGKSKTQTKADTISARFGKFITAHQSLSIYKDGKYYLKAEAWQYLLSMLGLYPSCECLTMMKQEKDGTSTFVGVKVEVILTKGDGTQVCKSMMVARCEEEWLKDKPEYAVYGLAQTRAISRAARNLYGWVAVQAGFEATPWDEMPH